MSEPIDTIIKDLGKVAERAYRTSEALASTGYHGSASQVRIIAESVVDAIHKLSDPTLVVSPSPESGEKLK